jgi:LmbE family N-acetylglucosaminyl deacetylase
MAENEIPESAMVIVAHPDDAEFTMAGTVAVWTEAGCRVTYVLCTDGNAGSHEPGMTQQELAQIRRAEQRAACATLGVRDVVFLGYDDGQLQATLELRRDLVRELRRCRPQVVLTSDPTRWFVGDQRINHPDHRAAGQAALEAVFPAAEMPLLWPEVGEPHKVHQVYVYAPSEPNHWVDISATIDQKIEALKKHASQMGDWDPTDRIKAWNAEVGQEHGLDYAEAYRVIRLVRPEARESNSRTKSDGNGKDE